jgi:serine phosphatase RsbU (regulator of sigma subunit)
VTYTTTAEIIAAIAADRTINRAIMAAKRTEQDMRRIRIEHADGDVSFIYPAPESSREIHREHTPQRGWDHDGMLIAAVIVVSVCCAIALGLAHAWGG